MLHPTLERELCIPETVHVPYDGILPSAAEGHQWLQGLLVIMANTSGIQLLDVWRHLCRVTPIGASSVSSSLLHRYVRNISKDTAQTAVLNFESYQSPQLL